MKTRIYLFLSVAILIAASLLLSFGKDDAHSEKSFKTGKAEPRYLKEFKKEPYRLPKSHAGENSDHDSLQAYLQKELVKACEYASELKWFKKLQAEHLWMYIPDHGNMPFTMHIEDGEFSVTKGFDSTQTPTLLIPLTQSNVENLAEILSDGVLTYEEQYRMYYIITVPALKAIYKNEILYKPGDKSIFKFDDFVHIVIPPTEEVLYNGKPISIEATAVNVDGQWMVFHGLQGDPDFRISLSLEEATELYKLGFYEVRNISSPKEARNLSQKFLKHLESVTAYVRADHK